MYTILIPLDFSTGTQNVLDYIVHASKDIPISRIILLKSMYTSVFQPIIASAEYLCLDKGILEMTRVDAERHMATLTERLLKKVDTNIKVDNALSEAPLSHALIEVIKQENPDLLVLNSGLPSNEGYIANNLIQLATISTIPVMIIPPNATYRKINTVMIPVDFEELNRLVAFKHPFIATNKLNYSLKVFSIKQNQTRSEFQDFKSLSALLEGYTFSVHYTGEQDILDGILNFAKKNDPELIVALPGKYNFFKKITHRSITQAIANKSNHPVLILKQGIV